MKRNTSIKLKAALLLIVFALNTVVGFACSVGMNMGFNSQHHTQEGTVPPIHVHHNSKDASPKQIDEARRQESHKHTNGSNRHTSDSKKKDCCTDEVKQFHDLDKSVPNVKVLVHPLFVTGFLASYYHIDLLCLAIVVKDVKRFVQHDHPPITKIRIAIQLFQI